MESWKDFIWAIKLRSNQWINERTMTSANCHMFKLLYAITTKLNVCYIIALVCHYQTNLGRK